MQLSRRRVLEAYKHIFDKSDRMPGSGSSSRPKSEKMSRSKIKEELDKMATYLLDSKTNFKDIGLGCYVCIHEGRHEAMRPLLEQLGYDVEVRNIYTTADILLIMQ